MKKALVIALCLVMFVAAVSAEEEETGGLRSLQGGKCKRCHVSFCKWCNCWGRCEKCRQGYFLKHGKCRKRHGGGGGGGCKKCYIKNCKRCDCWGKYCKKCRHGYYERHGRCKRWW